jgi:hypothetical protein
MDTRNDDPDDVDWDEDIDAGRNEQSLWEAEIEALFAHMTDAARARAGRGAGARGDRYQDFVGWRSRAGSHSRVV